jgi:putative ABC transport system ATP-binding protein
VSAPGPPLLRVRGLGKRFGAMPVFSDVSFDLARGEVVAVLGESGVGKSTLLNCIAGLEPIDAGEVALDGRPLPWHDDTALAHWRRAHLGFVFQAFHVLPHLSVAQNVALPLLLLGRDDGARVRAMLQGVGLEALADRLPRTLSGGQLQRVAIARALVHAPPLVLADEPTGNLDATTAARVLEVLTEQMRAQGAACLIATHSPAAAAHADRAVMLTVEGLRPLPVPLQ